VVSEVSPYEADLDWGELTEPADIVPVVDQLGRATAKVHCVSDSDSDHSLVPFQTEEAITAVIGDATAAFSGLSGVNGARITPLSPLNAGARGVGVRWCRGCG
jgi:hypothetical protein